MFLGFLSFPRIKRREREKRQEKNMGPKKSSKQREKGKSSGGSKKGMMGGDDDGEELPQDLSVTPEQLHAQVAALQAEKAKEAKDRNRMQIERVYNQKMKHLLYEQQNIIATIKTDHELALKLQHGQFAKHETELLNDQRALKEKMKELEVGYEDTIRQIKLEDVTDMKKKEAANEKLMYEIAQENKRLTEPLARALKEVENLRMMLAHYEKDKLSLQQSRLQYSEVLNKFKDLEWKYRLLEESFEKVKEEKDNIATSFHNNIFNVQQKCGLKSLLLQQKVQVLDEEVEKKEAQLGEIFNAAKLDLNELGSAKDRVNKVLESKNREIRVLYYENGKIRSAYNSIIKAFEAKLAEYGIPLQEMGLPYYIADISV
ncbi:hypothetical protein O6H91_08G119900 [Diphasiastrum complanatum]|uniref:Uncharacterized protein n=1 Tax=Diphasiastrum complanatum TaxID=34168 RepID=A0ACC2D1N6_DIPCM|nr:hypothetical protein O6H91_08G119900 [Diphasiastrum complanatum]